MTKTTQFFILIAMLAGSTVHTQGKFMSFNIRFDNPSDGPDRWELRKDELFELITRYDPDFIGIQEALPNQVEFLEGRLANHRRIGVGRDGKGTDSESVPIFYKHEEFTLLNWEVFWLSETPGIPSRGWDAALNRITTYGVFMNNRTQDTIHVFNTHFDHRGEKARANSSQLLISKLKTLDLLQKQVVLMGDFNSLPEEEPIEILRSYLKDAYAGSEDEVSGPLGTFNGFDPDSPTEGRIDYIFTINLRVLSYATLDDKIKNGRWISDHLPVLVQVYP